MARLASPLLVVADWIQAHCRVPDGFHAGAEFILGDEQLAFTAAHYLVRPGAKLGELATAFVYRRSQLVRAQKWGKSPLIAAFVCAEAVGPVLFAGWAKPGDVYDCRDHGCGCGWLYEYEPGEPMGMAWPTPLIQITATSEDQTENTYDALRPMIELGPLAEVIRKTGEEFIRLPNGGRIDIVTSKATSRLGQRVTFVPQDETGIWTVSNGMAKVARTQRRGLAGMGGRSIETTNSWDPAENSVAQQTYESSARDVYKDFQQPPAHLKFTVKADRRKMFEVNYRGAPWVNIDSIEAEAAELAEKYPDDAERFFGNRIVAGKGHWLPDGLWESAKVERPAPPAGTEVCLGFDGSDNDDWTGIRLRTLDGYRFTPTYGPDARATCWNPAEWGGSIPRGEVNTAIEEITSRYKVIRAYCDPRDWQTEIGDWALRHGEDVFLEWATYRTVHMHDALNRSVTDISSGRATHDACPHTEAHVANARKIAKPGDRYLLAKPNQHQKIDMAMADTLAHEAGEDARTAGWGAPAPTNYIYSA